MLLSPTRGRLDCVVKGARKSRRWGALVEPFSHLAGEFRQGGGLATLSEARLVTGFTGVREDLDRLLAGALWLDLFSQLAQPEQESLDLFRLLVSALHLLEGKVEPALVGLWLEAQTLLQLGVGQLDTPLLRMLSGCGPRALAGLRLQPAQVTEASARLRRGFVDYEPGLDKVFRRTEGF